MDASFFNLAGHTAAVLGAGISGRPLIEFLTSQGVTVTVRDQREREAFADLLPIWEAQGVKTVFGADWLSHLTEELLFRSPGIRPDLPPLKEAQAKGSILSSEIELFFALCPCPIVGISGSDGKTTTTTIVSRFLTEAYESVFVGGNIGEPLLPRLSQMQPSDIVVAELSSFQLQTMRRSPSRAVLTNLSPNHLDYHRSFSEYAEAKSHLLCHPDCRVAVLNADDPALSSYLSQVATGAELRRFGHGDPSYTVYERDGSIYHGNTLLLAKGDIRLPGRHNLENFMAACAVCLDLVSPEAMQKAARGFHGVPHRLESVAEREGVEYINSSIDSSPSRTKAALSALSDRARHLIVLLGGYDKQLSFSPLAEPLARLAKAVIVSGSTKDKIRTALTEDAAFAASGVPLFSCDSLRESVSLAKDLAQYGDTVLLSPACASFDAFRNFEERGMSFAKWVREG